MDDAVTAAMYSGDTEEPDALSVAAYLACRLARNHCFVDGNKRTAWSALAYVLRAQGVDIAASQEEVATLMGDVAQGGKQPRDLARWLAAPGRLRSAPST